MLMTSIAAVCLLFSVLAVIDYVIVARGIRQREATISRLVARGVALEREATGRDAWRAGL